VHANGKITLVGALLIYAFPRPAALRSGFFF
jgi:hypothetical protein